VRLGSAAALLVLALVAAPSARAHVSVTPGLLVTGGTETIVLTVHNDRRQPMTGFELTVPAGFAVAAPAAPEGWSGEVGGRVARWSGGELAPDAPVSFEVSVAAPAVTGPAELRAGQVYANGDVLEWPLSLTVAPGEESSSESIGILAIVAVLVVLALVTVAFVFLRRRRGSLQER
jgi:uncharacterized membrane protein